MTSQVLRCLGAYIFKKERGGGGGSESMIGAGRNHYFAGASVQTMGK